MAYSSEHVRTASVKSSVHGKELLYSMNSACFFSPAPPYVARAGVSCPCWPLMRPDHEEVLITVSNWQTPFKESVSL